MSIHYLVSLYNGEINDVVAASGATPQTLAVGNQVIRVPDDIPVRDPVDLSDLLTKKYAGILGISGLFTQVIYDDMQDGSGVNTGASNGITLGDKGAVSLYPRHASYIPVLQTTPYNITWGGVGAGPTEAILTYELFEFVESDPKTGVYQRSYKEVVPDVDVSVQISFNNGGNFTSASDRALLTIPTGSTGTQVVLRFTRNTDINVRGRVYLGSWAVLF